MHRNPMPVLAASIVGLGLAAEAAVYCSVMAARAVIQRASALCATSTSERETGSGD